MTTEVSITRAVGYVRVSTEGQGDEGCSLDVQTSRIEAYCAARGWQLLRVYREVISTGLPIEERAELVRALRTTGPGVALVAVKLDRLTRSVPEVYELLRTATDRGAGLVAIDESFDLGTATGRAMMGIVGVFAQWQRETISERTSASLQHLKLTGRPYCRPDFGYRVQPVLRDGRVVDRRLAEDPDEQETCRLILDMRQRGATYKGIASQLTQMGRRTRSGSLRWWASSVQSVHDRAAARSAPGS